MGKPLPWKDLRHSEIVSQRNLEVQHDWQHELHFLPKFWVGRRACNFCDKVDEARKNQLG